MKSCREMKSYTNGSTLFSFGMGISRCLTMSMQDTFCKISGRDRHLQYFCEALLVTRILGHRRQKAQWNVTGVENTNVVTMKTFLHSLNPFRLQFVFCGKMGFFFSNRGKCAFIRKKSPRVKNWGGNPIT